ncbi:MAG: LacI family transcriptional regulator [Glaciihabitans sp.]|jgi:DNA-binding LacI/PurR family transcriptional regulator|nr:LacI family transcriptional regulator [Glaciihabitans sp.]MDQ1570023.1 LacI family transcriptional regulator, repressor for deo operon, udp, cdd, tsx, nupC, and nupG [Actinomycetota bacterium]
MSAPTLLDVANAAGVATSTASRALSNPGRVSAATRLRIEEAARAVGYARPSRGRSAGRTHAVAVLVADISNPFYFDIIRGTQLQLRAANYTQVLIDTEESGELEADLINRMRASFDGVVLAASRLSDRAITELAETVPLVVINRNVPKVPSVVIDTATGMDQALEHLVSLGHRSIVYVSGPERSWANAVRWRALTAAAERHDVALSRVGPFAPRRTAGSAAADAVLNSGATGAIAYNDLLAIGMLGRLAERGVSVPGRLSIVGCDDIFGADFCNPPLTTVTAPIDQAGRVAVALLLGMLESRSGGRRDAVMLPTHLTVRTSTGAAP